METAFILFLASSTFLLTLYAFYFYRLTKRYKKNIEEDTVSISGQRERIETNLYELRKLMQSSPDRFFDTNKILLQVSDDDISLDVKTPNLSFFKNLGLDLEHVEQKKNTVFCMMPFNKSFQKTYESINAACKKAGFECLRSDTPYNPGNLLKQIVTLILNSEVIVALLDGQNPNVFYEIGIAHCIGKPVFLLANLSRNEEIPFDIKSDRLLLYSNYEELKDFLYIALKNIHHAE